MPSISPEALFPIPSRPPAPLSPAHWPGISPASTDALLTVLKHNHEHWHTFTNDKHFHNHAPHRSLALWALGTDGEVIRAGYKKDCGYEKPAITPPGHITHETFAEHLGDERYYHAYLDFFSHRLQTQGVASTLEEYLVGTAANLGVDESPLVGTMQQMMLARFFAGIFHPLIHTGYGLEFGLPGIIAEGLAQTAVHPASGTAPLVPPALFDGTTYSTLANIAESAGHAIHDALDSAVQSLDAAFEAILSKDVVKNIRENPTGMPHVTPEGVAAATLVHLEEHTKTKDVHALDILGWVSKDMRFAPAPDPKHRDTFDTSIGRHAEILLKFSRLWKMDVSKLGSDQSYLDSKIEELAFVVTVMYGVGGWTGRGKNKDGSPSLFNADFFLMHLVTSSVFIPSICAFLSPASRARFLHTYLALALATYVFRGCPPLDIVGFMRSEEPQPKGPQPQPGKGTLPSPNSAKAVNPDPWLPIIQTSVVHPDEHVSKTQRSLAHWASAFGSRNFSAKSGSDCGEPVDDPAASGGAGLGLGWGARDTGGSEGQTIPLEIRGADFLNGTVFLKVAELTAAKMKRVREGEDATEFWDFKGFYDRNDASGLKSHL